MKGKQLSRRQFITILAAAGSALAMGLPVRKKNLLVSRSRVLMGTQVNLTLISSDRGTAERAIDACLTEMARLEQVLSRHLSHSQLSQLNRTGLLGDPHPALRSLINQSRQISELSGGAFDITVKPLQDLYDQASGIPRPEQVQNALGLVDFRNLVLEADLVRFRVPGMGATLDGIAKGYIVDAGIAQLTGAGFGNVLVEAGGDLSAAGGRGNDLPWRIGLQDPRADAGEILARVNLRDRSLATSGDYLHNYTADLSSHHILDPRTGHSSPELASVSVSAPSAALADGLATAVMVLGLNGLALVQSLAECEAYLVTKQGQTHRTSGFITA